MTIMYITGRKTTFRASFDGVAYDVDVKFESGGGRAQLHRSVTPRIFLWGEPSPEDLSTSDFTEHPPYGSQRGDGSSGDKQWKRYNKEAIAIMREFSSAALDALGLAGLYEGTSYNRNAGCSCGCSSGMNIKGLDTERANPVLGTFGWSKGDMITINIEKAEEAA